MPGKFLKRTGPRISLLVLALAMAALVAVIPVLLTGDGQGEAAAGAGRPGASTQPAPAPAAADPTIELCAKEGTINVAGAGTVDIWGFAVKPEDKECSDPSVQAQLPGPTLTINEGDVLTINLYNNLDVNVSIIVPQLQVLPDTVGVPPSTSDDYTFTADRPGTFLYESGRVAQEGTFGNSSCSDGDDNDGDSDVDADDSDCANDNDARIQVPMGLYGALIVRPSSGANFAYNFTGLLSLAIISERADVNGDGVINGMDDSNSFFGNTSVVDGGVDCDAGIGNAGNLAIAIADDCTLTPSSGPAVSVQDGEFQIADGPLAASFSVPDVAWRVLNGRVDSNGNGLIDGDDCTFGLVGATDDVDGGDMTDGADVLGNPGDNECGFASAPDPANNGLVDLDSDGTITSADTCSNGCFFGHNLSHGTVQDADSEFDVEAVLVLSEIDPALNADPDGFNTQYYAPKYWLINGKAYPDTAEITADEGDQVLIRYLNAGLVHHTMNLVGLHQTVFAGDAYPLTFSYEAVSLTVASGQTFDNFVTIPLDIPSDTDTLYPLYSANLHVTNVDAFPGGMLTFVSVDAGP